MAIGAQTVATLLSAKDGDGGSAGSFPLESDYITVFAFVCSTAIGGICLVHFLPKRLAIRDD